MEPLKQIIVSQSKVINYIMYSQPVILSRCRVCVIILPGALDTCLEFKRRSFFHYAYCNVYNNRLHCLGTYWVRYVHICSHSVCKNTFKALCLTSKYGISIVFQVATHHGSCTCPCIETAGCVDSNRINRTFERWIKLFKGLGKAKRHF